MGISMAGIFQWSDTASDTYKQNPKERAALPAQQAWEDYLRAMDKR